jgi:hypothetical protein
MTRFTLGYGNQPFRNSQKVLAIEGLNDQYRYIVITTFFVPNEHLVKTYRTREVERNKSYYKERFFCKHLTIV